MIRLPGAADESPVSTDKKQGARCTLHLQGKLIDKKQGARCTLQAQKRSPKKHGGRDTLQAGNKETESVIPGLSAGWYDEFAIGWNEIFDQEAVEPPKQQKKQVENPPQQPVNTTVTLGATSKRATKEEEGSASAFWASEVLTSKKPPAYLKIQGGKRSVIDRGMKEQMLLCPVSQLRKPSEVMDIELEQVRAGLIEAHREKKRLARASRRLERRCRVKDGEDLEELEAKYLSKESAESPIATAKWVADPGDQSESPPQSARSAKTFFQDLASRRTVKTVPLPVRPGPPATFHWSTAPHTAR